MVRIELISGSFLEINTCHGNGTVHTSDLGIALDCSQFISPLSVIVDSNTWSSIGSNHNQFKCATTFANSLLIRTTLSSPSEDILVKIDHISATHFDQIGIYPSDSYIASSSQFSDKCLCGIKNDILDLEECKKALLNNCMKILTENLSDEDKTLIDRIIDECILDKRVKIK